MVLMNLFAEQEQRYRESGPVDTAGEGEGGMNGEHSTDIYILPCKMDS